MGDGQGNPATERLRGTPEAAGPSQARWDVSCAPRPEPLLGAPAQVFTAHLEWIHLLWAPKVQDQYHEQFWFGTWSWKINPEDMKIHYFLIFSKLRFSLQLGLTPMKNEGETTCVGFPGVSFLIRISCSMIPPFPLGSTIIQKVIFANVWIHFPKGPFLIFKQFPCMFALVHDPCWFSLQLTTEYVPHIVFRGSWLAHIVIDFMGWCLLQDLQFYFLIILHCIHMFGAQKSVKNCCAWPTVTPLPLGQNVGPSPEGLGLAMWPVLVHGM